MGTKTAIYIDPKPAILPNIFPIAAIHEHELKDQLVDRATEVLGHTLTVFLAFPLFQCAHIDDTNTQGSDMFPSGIAAFSRENEAYHCFSILVEFS